MSELNYIRNVRGLAFVEIGMRVEVSGRNGVIVGSNDSGNLEVQFVDNDYATNCHPTWETVYYGKDGNVIADYRL